MGGTRGMCGGGGVERYTGLWWGNLNSCVPRIFHSRQGYGSGGGGGGGKLTLRLYIKFVGFKNYGKNRFVIITVT